MDAELIRAHRDLPQLMPFLHLPVQSGSDAVLEAMNRRYSADDYRRLVDALRAARPDLALSSDFIVGFPGESDADFAATMQLVEEIGFAQAYSFKYSARPGTPASALRRQVPEAVKSARLQQLQERLEAQAAAFNAACVGATLPVLLERPGRHPGQLVGRTPYLQAVHVDGEGLAIGDLVAGGDHALQSAQPGRRRRADGDHREGATRLSTLAPLPDLRGSSHRMHFDDNAACAVLFGQHHLNLARIEQKLPVSIVTRGNEVFIQGESEGEVKVAAAVLQDLYGQLKRGSAVGRDEVDATLRMLLDGPEHDGVLGETAAVRTERKLVTARSPNQAAYLRALDRHDLVFALGPAGTGKTYLAVAMAVALLKQRRIERIILSRPAVEAGERLGFLPGDLKDKVDPYMRPLYDALQDMLPEGKLQQRIDAGQIEIAPLAYMRGRTLSSAYVILDEAQNTTPSQMKMFLTRMGENSRMIITGDPTQTDLPPGMPSGLSDAVRKLGGLQAVSVVRFDKKDVVRHPLVGAIIEAYETAARQAAQPNEETPPPQVGVAAVSEHGQRQ